MSKRLVPGSGVEVEKIAGYPRPHLLKWGSNKEEVMELRIQSLGKL